MEKCVEVTGTLRTNSYHRALHSKLHFFCPQRWIHGNFYYFTEVGHTLPDPQPFDLTE